VAKRFSAFYEKAIIQFNNGILEQFNEAVPHLFERRSVEFDDLVDQVPDNSSLNKVRLHIPSVSTEQELVSVSDAMAVASHLPHEF
jgi:hypothetical protein